MVPIRPDLASWAGSDFSQRNLAGHHLLTFYLRELSIVAHKLGPAELA